MTERYYASVCACIKDEPEDHLREWVEWNLLIGFEHFFLFDDQSRVPVSDTLAGYAPWLSVRRDPALSRAHRRQLIFYSDCVRRHRADTRWLAIIDADEFIVLKRPGDDVRRLLADYEAFGGLAINWKMFGSSGHRRSPRGLVIENFRHCRRDSHVKTLAQTRHVESAPNPHFVRYRPGFCSVDPAGRPVGGPWNPDGRYGVCQINHYFTKSLEDFERKVGRGNADGSEPRSIDEFYREEEAMEGEDTFIVRRADELRDRLRRRARGEATVTRNPPVAKSG
jgi:hypothetical protein